MAVGRPAVGRAALVDGEPGRVGWPARGVAVDPGRVASGRVGDDERVVPGVPGVGRVGAGRVVGTGREVSGTGRPPGPVVLDVGRPGDVPAGVGRLVGTGRVVGAGRGTGLSSGPIWLGREVGRPERNASGEREGSVRDDGAGAGRLTGGLDVRGGAAGAGVARGGAAGVGRLTGGLEVRGGAAGAGAERGGAAGAGRLTGGLERVGAGLDRGGALGAGRLTGGAEERGGELALGVLRGAVLRGVEDDDEDDGRLVLGVLRGALVDGRDVDGREASGRAASADGASRASIRSRWDMGFSARHAFRRTTLVFIRLDPRTPSRVVARLQDTGLNAISRMSIFVASGPVMGCAPGSIAWPTGEDDLRTALYVEAPRDGLPAVTMVLSNGVFDCDLPSEPDPIDQTQALLEIRTAACRENARHVLVELIRGDGIDWVGRYPGDSHLHPDQISADRPRLSNASYYGIDEAVMVSAEGFVREYGVPSGGDQSVLDAGDGGEVWIRADGDVLAGTFDFPEADVSGRFRARECAPSSTLFMLLAQSPVAACPSTGPVDP